MREEIRMVRIVPAASSAQKSRTQPQRSNWNDKLLARDDRYSQEEFEYWRDENATVWWDDEDEVEPVSHKATDYVLLALGISFLALAIALAGLFT